MHYSQWLTRIVVAIVVGDTTFTGCGCGVLLYTHMNRANGLQTRRPSDKNWELTSETV